MLLTRAIKCAFAYRTLQVAAPPPPPPAPTDPDIPMVCHFCSITKCQLWHHVRSRFLAAFLHFLRARARLLYNASPTPGAMRTADGVVLDDHHRLRLQCTWHTHFTDDAITRDALTLLVSGM